MGWQSDRPVPWRRVLREAAIFLVVGAVVLTLLVKKKDASVYIGLVVGMIFYVGIVAIFAKFGYQRETFREARERRATTTAAASRRTQVTETGRARPAPTRRTSTGPSQRPNRSKRKKR